MEDRIDVEKDEVLLSRAFIVALATKLVAYGFSRMGGFIWLMETILDYHDDGGRIYDGGGVRIEIHPDIVEDAFFWDLSFTWITAVKVFAHREAQRNPQERLLPRLRLFDAAFKIKGDPIVLD